MRVRIFDVVIFFPSILHGFLARRVVAQLCGFQSFGHFELENATQLECLFTMIDEVAMETPAKIFKLTP
jgi:hypothetical protein